MRKFILILIAVLSITGLSITRSAFSVESMEKCDHSCAKCHQVTDADVQKLLEPNFPDVKVLEVRPSQVKGLLEVAVVSKGQKGVIYIDSSKKYLITGSILDASTRANYTQERYAELTKVDVSKIPLDDALLLGDKDAKYRAIVFDDPE